MTHQRPTPEERQLAEYAALMRRLYAQRGDNDRVVEAPTQPRWLQRATAKDLTGQVRS